MSDEHGSGRTCIPSSPRRLYQRVLLLLLFWDFLSLLPFLLTYRLIDNYTSKIYIYPRKRRAPVTARLRGIVPGRPPMDPRQIGGVPGGPIGGVPVGPPVVPQSHGSVISRWSKWWSSAWRCSSWSQPRFRINGTSVPKSSKWSNKWSSAWRCSLWS